MKKEEFNKKREELIELLKKMDENSVDVGSLMQIAFILQPKPLTKEGEVAWAQGYKDSSTHKESHSNDTPGPHSKSWSKTIDA